MWNNFIAFKLAKERSRRYSTQTYGCELRQWHSTSNKFTRQAESLLHSLEWEAGSIGLHVNADKTEYRCFNERGDMSTLKGSPLKLVDKFTYLRSNISLTMTDINTWLAKTWTAINSLSVIWKSDLTGRIKRSFFQAAVVLILLYECTTWMLTKHMEKKLDGNYTRMLQAILNKSWRQLPTKQQLYCHLPPVMKTIQIKQTRYAGLCWRGKDKLISDVLLWIPSHGWAKVGQPTSTYIQQLCVDAGCSLEDLPGAMDDRNKERIREIHAGGATWWWWWWWLLS